MRNIDAVPGGYSDAYAINNRGQVVGTMNHSNVDRGFIWEDDGKGMTDLGDLAGGHGSTYAYKINNLGQVVGESWGPSLSHHAFLWQNGTMTDLGVLPDGSDASYALGINDSAVVVGMSYVWGSSLKPRATIWDSVNGLRDLNGMVDSSGDGWILGACHDINNAGQIVGWGYHDGQLGGFVLTPVPEPSTLIVWSLLGASGIGFGWWRRKPKA